MKRKAVLCMTLPLSMVLFSAGCTGFTQGENDPGGDTWLEAGSIAVDPSRETAFVMTRELDENQEVLSKTLFAVDPDSGQVDTVADLTACSDTRMLFPGDRLMLMCERNGSDELRLLDGDTLQVVNQRQTTARYNGTRLAPSGRFIAVADGAASGDPIHLVDASSLESHVIPHNGYWLEAMWLNHSDVLLAVVFYNETSEIYGGYARLLGWSVEALEASGFEPGAGGLWPDPVIDATALHVIPDFLFSYTWVGVSPTDQYAVFPVQRVLDASDNTLEHQLLVLAVDTQEVRTVSDARGPVGFTPDGATIVSYRYVRDAQNDLEPNLLMVDTSSLETELVDLPLENGPQYYVTREGNFVIVAGQLGNETLLLYDVDNTEMTQLAGLSIDLNEFVSRLGEGELWLVDNGLYRLDFFDGQHERIPLGWTPAHINILRQRDLLVLDDTQQDRIVFFDPNTESVVRQALLQ